MAREQKQTVDYFPHYADASQRKTITILQNKYGDAGYAIWFRLLEALASSDGHYINCSLQLDWEYLTRRLYTDNDMAINILKTLAELDAIDRELWEQKKIIWSDNFVANIADVYRNRRRELPLKPGNNGSLPVAYTQFTVKVHPQSKVKETKVNKSKVEDTTPILTNEKPTTTELPKNSYGEGRIVKLTDGEYQKLLAKFGLDELNKRIDKLATYIGSKGKKYKSHYMTILNWALNDDRNTLAKQGKDFRPVAHYEDMTGKKKW